MKKIMTISATAVAAVIALAGCSNGSAGTSASSMPMDHGSMSSAPAAADHNAADAMFAQSMIPHHEQAVEMSDLILGKQGIDAKVTELANRIKAAQAPEIEQMRAWLKSWKEPTDMAGHDMSGMMSEADLAKLKDAQGTEAARLFLTQMIAHHEGAVTMAKKETSEGKNPDAIALSKEITTSQEAEIQEMKVLLAAL